MQKLRLNVTSLNYYNATYQPSYKNPAHLKKLLKDYYEVPAPLLKGTMAHILLRLEQRIDIVLVRTLLVTSLMQSRQLVNHCHVKINGRIVQHSGYTVKPGDFIELKIKVTSSPTLLWKNSFSLPEYVEVNYALQTCIYLRAPRLEELSIPFPIDKSTPLS